MSEVKLGDRVVGDGHPTYIIGEIGINHNGDIETAKQLIDAAVAAGCDAVKFQKRTPDLCVPADMKDVQRETPWGIMSYLDYRKRVEFGRAEYKVIDDYCRDRDIAWFVSCWDSASVDFMNEFNPICFKIASACLTDDELLKSHRRVSRPILLSTGMSTLAQIDHAVEVLGKDNLILMHCTSSYPADLDQLNLRVIDTLKRRYGTPVGYSGHEVGLVPSVVSVAMGACAVERHITLDRAMWGSDQSASVESHGLVRLVRDIRAAECSMGDGEKRVYEGELLMIKRLRRHA